MVETLATLCTLALVLTVVDGKPTTTSLDIAKHFGRPHDEVLRRIRNLLAQLTGEPLRNFAEGSYTLPSTGGQQHRMYRITRDGFTLLAMGFTGKKALQFKLAYIDAFNKMEAELVSAANKLPPSPGRSARALLLSGQIDPVPMPAAIHKAIDKAAWRMAGETYDLARKHLARRVAWQHTNGPRNQPNVMQAEALADLRTVTLGDVLSHEAHSQLTHTLACIKTARDIATLAAATVEHQIAALAD